MANNIKLLHSTTAGNVPSLVSGQVALNEADDIFFWRHSDGTVKKLPLNPRIDNLVISGGMEVDQVFVGAAQTGKSASFYAIENCWFDVSGGGIFTVQQVADAPAGLRNSIKLSVTTADTSLATSDNYALQIPIEGKRLRTGWGAAGAQSIAAGFWVKANRIGTYSGSIFNNAGNRAYPFSFTINVSGTWEYKTVVVPGDTTGTWVSDSSGAGLWFTICLAAGTTRLGTANTWAAASLLGVTGTINGVAATSDYMNITGVVVIPGTMPPSQEQSTYFIRSFAEELQLCKRYYQKSYDYGTALGTVTINGATSFALTASLPTASWFAQWAINFNPSMRTAPTMSAWNSATGASGTIHDSTDNTEVTPAFNNTGETGFCVNASTSSPNTNFNMKAHWVADARM